MSADIVLRFTVAMIFEYSTKRRSTAVEAAAPLAGQQRRGVDARNQRARARRTRPTARCPTRTRSCTSSSTPRKTGDSTRRLSRSSDCTSGMPALSSVASSWLKTRNSLVGIRRDWAKLQRQPADGAFRLQRQDVEALLLELVAQPCFVLGRVDALDDFTARGREAAAELHYSPEIIATPTRRCPSER